MHLYTFSLFLSCGNDLGERGDPFEISHSDQFEIDHYIIIFNLLKVGPRKASSKQWAIYT